MKDNYFFNYTIKTSDGQEKKFNIHLNKNDLSLASTVKDNYPAWTELENNQCPHCPLKINQSKHCPIAINIIDIIDFLKDILSCDQAAVTIETNRRNYFKNTDMQSVAGSMIGIYMVTSGCPIMDKLRPMAAFHLPFASLEETKYRAISMYLIAQYIISTKSNWGKNPDWKLKNLNKIYEDINVVNISFIKRLKQIDNIEDASLNAIIKLDCFAQAINISLNAKTMEDIKTLFKAYT